MAAHLSTQVHALLRSARKHTGCALPRAQYRADEIPLRLAPLLAAYHPRT